MAVNHHYSEEFLLRIVNGAHFRVLSIPCSFVHPTDGICECVCIDYRLGPTVGGN